MHSKVKGMQQQQQQLPTATAATTRDRQDADLQMRRQLLAAQDASAGNLSRSTSVSSQAVAARAPVTAVNPPLITHQVPKLQAATPAVVNKLSTASSPPKLLPPPGIKVTVSSKDYPEN